MRVFALSDIHVDYPVNARWIADLSVYDFTDDIVILAGDVSHKIRDVETTLLTLCKRFKQVFFVPGNHDIWVMKDETINSIEKFDQVCTLATQIGASITPLHYQGLSIIPLFSWYDYSFGLPSEKLKNSWADYVACSWPQAMNNPEINDYFLEKNTLSLSTVMKETVISFSHFLPRIDVMPSFIPKAKQFLYPVLGSNKLDKQIREIKANIHIYGHSHVNRHVEIDGVTYINNAFGYPNEHRIAAKELRCVYGGS